ncbi:iron-hydroxamate ABC transporter substrate-binding protein [Solibacillus sp. FSL K6-1523]|uniref:iron-hydroxamate ABC transporter substrate-binding protein n=1 Tax=Solibacillus sp. FSL K6-1523 TaxID=2921471 RepID=UPI0030F90435
MKKWLLPMFMMVAIVLAACGNNEESEENTGKETSAETITYQSETGPIEVPANPQRVVVLSSYAGDLINLGVNMVGVDSWSANNSNFAEGIKDAEIVANTDIEKILELNPDLIIGLNNIENADKLSEIAPTVLFTYGKNDYLQQHIEIGKVVNKEAEAIGWVKDFKVRAAELGTKIKEKIGEDATVTVVENYEKQFYLFGDNWGRGTEILYQEMGLKMPEKVTEVALEPGYFAISQEVIGEYTGDFVILSLSKEQDSAFLNTDWYNEIEAVKNGQLFEVDSKEFYFNDAMTLDYQLDFFEEKFLK